MGTATLTYEAFISYSHADAKWAGWLHRSIETYRVPKRLLAERPELPARLAPLFRDREELPSAVDLGQKIEAALGASKRLIVVCSPRAAASQWVNEEIRRFKAMGRADQIFTIIVEGEPNAAARGRDPALECFPEQLRGDAQDPIAADLRPEGDGRRNAQFKLIAGMLGVGLDDLKRREAQRRQRRLVAVTAASIAGLIVTSTLAAYALIARRDAQREAETSRRTTDFMVQLFNVVDPSEARGRSVTAYEILEKGVGQIHQLNDAPEVQATLLETMGRVFTGLGLYPRSVEMLQEALTAQGIASAGTVATRIALGDALYLQGDYDGADENYRATLAALQHKPWSSEQTGAANGHADVLMQKGDFAGAIALYQDTYKNDVATWGAFDVRVARTSSGLATAQMGAGEYKDAESSYLHALDAYRAAFGSDHPKVSEMMSDLGSVRYFKGDVEGAAQYYRQALPVYRKVYGGVHPEVSALLNNLGRMELELRHIDAALSLLEESVSIDRQLNRSDHDDFVFALNSLALAYQAKGDRESAGQLLTEAVALAARHDHRMSGPILANEADLQCSAGHVAGTQDLLDEAARRTAHAYPDEPWRLAIVDSVRGQCLSYSDAGRRAEKLLLDSLSVIEARWGREALFTRDARARVAGFYERTGKKADARRYRSG